MKITVPPILGMLFILLLSGCGSDSSSDSGAISSLKGSWQYNCSVDEDGGSQQGNIIYSHDSLQFFASYYSDNDCQNLNIRIEMSGLYILGDVTALGSGAIATYLSQDITSFQVAYYDSIAVSVLNDSNVCNRSTWAMGELQEIRNCSEFDFDFEAFKKDIVMVNNNQIVSGDFDFIGEDGYPTQLESEVLLKKSSTELEGGWLQSCRVEDQVGHSRQLDIIGDTVSFTWTSYTDSSCDNVAFKHKRLYFLSLGRERVLASGETVNEIKLSIFSSLFSFYGEELVETINDIEIFDCGLSNWLDSGYKDVFECEWILEVLTSDSKNIVKIEGDELIFGDDNFTEEDGFSTQLQAEPYTRQ